MKVNIKWYLIFIYTYEYEYLALIGCSHVWEMAMNIGWLPDFHICLKCIWTLRNHLMFTILCIVWSWTPVISLNLIWCSPYFLLFGHEPKLPALIWWDVMTIINMDDLNVWIYTCEQQVTLFQRDIITTLKIWKLLNTRIHCVMSLYVKMVINLIFESSKVWTRRLCLLAAHNIVYFGCDYKMYYSMCAKGCSQLYNIGPKISETISSCLGQDLYSYIAPFWTPYTHK
jgi:hypothetical protein